MMFSVPPPGLLRRRRRGDARPEHAGPDCHDSGDDGQHRPPAHDASLPAVTGTRRCRGGRLLRGAGLPAPERWIVDRSPHPASGAVNGGYFCRGLPEDFDDWKLPGWSWDDVLPHFKAIETDRDFDGPLHGADGPMIIRRVRDREISSPIVMIADAASIDLAVQAGEIDAVIDYSKSNVFLLPAARHALRIARPAEARIANRLLRRQSRNHPPPIARPVSPQKGASCRL